MSAILLLSYQTIIDQWPIFAFYDKDIIMNLVEIAAEICEVTEAPLGPTIGVIASRLENELGHPTKV